MCSGSPGRIGNTTAHPFRAAAGFAPQPNTRAESVRSGSPAQEPQHKASLLLPALEQARELVVLV